eukprot:1705589-Pleurochrysis_carterae.AAC.1
MPCCRLSLWQRHRSDSRACADADTGPPLPPDLGRESHTSATSKINEILSLRNKLQGDLQRRAHLSRAVRLGAPPDCARVCSNARPVPTHAPTLAQPHYARVFTRSASMRDALVAAHERPRPLRALAHAHSFTLSPRPEYSRAKQFGKLPRGRTPPPQLLPLRASWLTIACFRCRRRRTSGCSTSSSSSSTKWCCPPSAWTASSSLRTRRAPPPPLPLAVDAAASCADPACTSPLLPTPVSLPFAASVTGLRTWPLPVSQPPLFFPHPLLTPHERRREMESQTPPSPVRYPHTPALLY